MPEPGVSLNRLKEATFYLKQFHVVCALGRDFPPNDLGRRKMTLTFFTKWGVTAPTQVPLAGESVTPHNVVARVALVCDPGSPDQFRVGSGFPAVLDFRQV